MKAERLLAFTDGVLAVIITIMVLELKAPHEPTFEALRASLPVFASYVLSFIYVAIYWNNHHHFFQLAHRVSGAVLWANLHLLFWVSLIPFTTSWLGEHPHDPAPSAAYGAVLLMSALAWYGMQWALIRAQGDDRLRRAIGGDWKGKASPPFYLLGIALSFLSTAAAAAVYVGVALLWLLPDRRVERVVG